MKNALSRQSLFFLFLRSYIILFIFLLVFSLFSYFITVDRITQSVERGNLVVLNGISSVIDRRFNEVERMAYRLANLGKTSKLAYMSTENSNYFYEMTNYVKVLWTLWLENDSLTSRMYIYFDRPSVVAAPSTFYDSLDFYNSFFNYGDLSSEEFYEMILDRDMNMRYLAAQPVNLQDNASRAGTYDLILYIYQFTSSTGVTPPGAIFFLIDINEIKYMMQSLNIGDGGLAAIIDNEENIVLKLDNNSGIDQTELLRILDDENHSSHDHMIISTISDRNGWNYVALGNPEVFMGPAVALRQLLILILTLSALGGFGLSFRLARQRSLPLFKLACKLNSDQVENEPKSSAERADLNTLERGVDKILDANISMQRRLRDLSPMLTPAFMHQLFTGSLSSREEIQAAARRSGLALPEGKYSVVAFHTFQVREILHSDQENPLRSLLAKDAIVECIRLLFGENELIYEQNPVELIWLYHQGGSSDEKDLLKALDQLVIWLEEHKLKVAVRYSRLFDDLSTAWWEYLQVRSNKSRSFKGSSIEFAWHNPDNQQQNFLLLVEPILIAMFRNGDFNMIGRLMDIVRKESLRVRNFDPESRRQITDELKNVIIKLVSDKWKQELAVLPDDFESALEKLRGVCMAACRETNISQTDSGTFLQRKACEFIDNNLYDSDLSLAMIAENLHVSEAYLSRIYKEHTGMNLAYHVEQQRIREACRLLNETTQTVSEISVKVGYNSDQVFRRAFKRVTGQSPNQYRQS